MIACLVGNALLTTALWFWTPKALLPLFFNVHELFFFPIVLASWMVSDVPATNEFGPDARRILAALDDPTMLTRLLRAKHLVLWTLVAPTVICVATVVGLESDRWLTMFFVLAWVVTVPLSSLGLASWVGIIWPYHPLPFRQRAHLALPWTRKWLRWIVLLVLPYGIVPLFGYLTLGPTLGLWHYAFSRSFRIGGHLLALSVLVEIPLSVWLWTWSTRYATVIARRRSVRLRQFLQDPSLG